MAVVSENKMMYAFAEIKSEDFNLEDGTFSGYASTFNNRDKVNDVVVRGAFSKTLPRFLGDGVILLSHMTEEPIGKPLWAEQDEYGLKLKGHISNTALGRDVLTLVRDGVLKYMSIGYQVQKEHWQGGVRYIDEADLYEVSLVPFPANPMAVIHYVKSVTPFQDLPLASRQRAWSVSAAEGRLRSWVSDTDPSEWEPADWTKYRRAFLVYDSAEMAALGSYKLPIADVIDGKLTVVPRAVFAAAAALQGARGGVKPFSDGDLDGAKTHIEQYYNRMAESFRDDTLVPPWHKDFVPSLQLKSYDVLDRPTILFAALADGGSLELKTGRTISKRNEIHLKEIIGLLQQALEEMTAAYKEKEDMDEKEMVNPESLDEAYKSEEKGSNYTYSGSEPSRIPAGGTDPMRPGDETGEHAKMPNPVQAGMESVEAKSVEDILGMVHDLVMGLKTSLEELRTDIKMLKPKAEEESDDAHSTHAEGGETHTIEEKAMEDEMSEDEEDEMHMMSMKRKEKNNEKMKPRGHSEEEDEMHDEIGHKEANKVWERKFRLFNAKLKVYNEYSE